MAELSHLEKCRRGYRLKKERERNPLPPQVEIPWKPKPPPGPDEWVDYGYANSWSPSPAGTPSRVKNCPDAHIPSRTSRKIGNCKWEYSCSICRYTYRVDSGD